MALFLHIHSYMNQGCFNGILMSKRLTPLCVFTAILLWVMTASEAQAKVLFCEGVFTESLPSASILPINEYPKLKATLGGLATKLRDWQPDPELHRLEELNDWRTNQKTLLTEKIGPIAKEFLPIDPQVENAIVAGANLINNKQEIWKILMQIFAEAVEGTQRSSLTHVLENGKVSGRILEKQLRAFFVSKRLKVSEVHDQDINEFQEALSQGPIVDVSIQNTGHGRLTHLIQMRLVYAQWEMATQGSPLKVYQFLGTEHGGRIWRILFDNQRHQHNQHLVGCPELFNGELLDWIDGEQ